MSTFRTLLFFMLLGGAAMTTNVVALQLYDDDLLQLPQQQNWLTLISTSGAAATAVSTGSRINTGSNGGTSPANEAGWFNKLPLPLGVHTVVNPLFPTLDSGLGFSLSFELQIHSETHTSGHRAGFSVILLDSNVQGVEIGFWENLVWAQNDNPLFQAAEDAVFDTTTAEVLYELNITGADYRLTANGVNLISGGTRDYGDYLTGLLTPDPYEIPSFIFLGDNTDSAYADFTLGQVQLTQDNPLPAPAVWLLLCLGLTAIHRLNPANRYTTR